MINRQDMIDMILHISEVTINVYKVFGSLIINNNSPLKKSYISNSFRLRENVIKTKQYQSLSTKKF